jgi:hypothetical protein
MAVEVGVFMMEAGAQRWICGDNSHSLASPREEGANFTGISPTNRLAPLIP